MKTGDKVRVKSLDEVLKIEGVEDYRDVDNPGIVDYMLEYFGKEGLVISCHNENENCVVSFDGDEWEFKKEWLELISDARVEEIKNPTYDDLLPLFSDTDSDDLDEVCSKPEIGGGENEKDLIEIVTTDDAYYVRCVYEVLKEHLADIDTHAWFVFDEVYELQDWNYDGFKKIYEYTKSDKEELLLNIKHIISISKLHEEDVPKENDK